MRIVKICTAVLILLLFAIAANAQAVATAELHVTVKDPTGRLVPNAKVTIRSEARNLERTVENRPEGDYAFLSVPPDQYSVTVEAPGFAKAVAHGIKVTVGQAAEFPVSLQLAAVANEITVTSQTEMVELQQTSVSTTIDQTRIDNLPINGRNYINFTLLNSQTARDNAPSIGAAPTSGLNIGGQRARSNLVNVDGTDAVDNSTNGIRSTVSQEAVQEFQLITNGYAAEYGRASGGVVNIITRSGTNDFHGSLYGYLRNRDFQAVNPFSTVRNPAYTRVQAGATAGGALVKNRTFYYLAYETTRRQETGFSTIGLDNYGLVPLPLPPAAGGTIMVTPDQAAFIGANISNPLLGPAVQQYAFLAGASSGMAVNGKWPAGFGGRVAFPLTCSPLAPACNPVPASYSGLASQAGNYPVSEGTTLLSGRLDHRLTTNNQFMLRVNVSPSTVTGLQVQGQNQNFGQNGYSRTAIQQYRDWALTAQETATLGNNKVNEFRFQYAYRGLLFDFNERTPTGPNVADNIQGFAFIGHEPFSPIRRTEERYQFSDDFSWSKGNHSFKFGADINRLPVSALFAVNFGGVYNFGEISASSFGFPSAFPSFNAVQAYGLGVPTTYIQGVGNPFFGYSNTPLGFFAQDSWRIKPNLTLNYGVRYDVELQPAATPLNAISAPAYAALGITNHIPQDNNNFAPRIGLAWDPWNNGKTVFRASYGLFYDHPLLGLQFLAKATDAVGTPQILLFGGTPCGAPGFVPTPATALTATNTFQGTLQNANCLGPALSGGFAYDPTQQRFTTNAPNSLWINQNWLQPTIPVAPGVTLPAPLGSMPFGFPLSSNFQYAYSEQANLAVEHDFGGGYSLELAYNFNGGHHLNRPINANAVKGNLLFQNYLAAVVSGQAAAGSNPLAVNACGMFPKAGGGTVPVVPTALVNFFRPSGMNPALAPWYGLLPANGVPTDCTTFASGVIKAEGLGVTASGTPFPTVPFSDMSANYSNGSSVYHGLTANLRKRFNHHYEMLMSYTWSHAIDDSTDLESPLAPQDAYNLPAERSNSTFDQRHRFVFSGVYQTGRIAGDSLSSKLLSDWTFAPIVEVSSGRPYTVITGVTTNFQFAPNSARPNLVTASTGVDACGDPVVTSPYLPGKFFQLPCPLAGSFDGNLGRNSFTKPYTLFNDLRIARRFHLTERASLDGIVDIFNLPNKFNVSDVNPLFTEAGRPTAAYDPRQFQFALRLSW